MPSMIYQKIKIEHAHRQRTVVGLFRTIRDSSDLSSWWVAWNYQQVLSPRKEASMMVTEGFMNLGLETCLPQCPGAQRGWEWPELDRWWMMDGSWWWDDRMIGWWALEVLKEHLENFKWLSVEGCWRMLKAHIRWEDELCKFGQSCTNLPKNLEPNHAKPFLK